MAAEGTGMTVAQRQQLVALPNHLRLLFHLRRRRKPRLRRTLSCLQKILSQKQSTHPAHLLQV